MFKFCSLFSGSTGNSLLVETENSKILVDAGESAKKIEQALSLLNVNVADLDGILVTHEHLDHVKSLGTLSKKYNIPVYATDLRAGAALIIAGIEAKGTTELYNLNHIDRGYECIEEKFRKLGANIRREE